VLRLMLWGALLSETRRSWLKSLLVRGFDALAEKAVLPLRVASYWRWARRFPVSQKNPSDY